MDAAAQIMERLDALGQISDEQGYLFRQYGTPAMRRANDLVRTWMAAAGMTAREDAIGNLIGHYPGTQPDLKKILLGSHLDTVRNAGKFDGPLGVVVAIACVEQFRKAGRVLPFGIDVAAFADEEGVRFQSAYLGSRAVTGALEKADLALAKAIREFGGNPSRLQSCRLNSKDLIGYVEVHIEQGPVLEQKNHAVGVVSAIAGQTRAKVNFRGKAAHAGTTPMALRQDALCAAAEFILTVEKYAQACPGLVATVGRITADPNISNVIPAAVELTLDVRHQDDATRQRACVSFQKIEQRRGTTVSFQTIQETASVQCSPDLSAMLREAAREHEGNVIDLSSGAGHDAAVMAAITPVAMLFVRCKDGVSHHPDESVRVEDVRVALTTLGDFISLLAAQA